MKRTTSEEEFARVGLLAFIPEEHRRPARGASIGATVGAIVGSVIGGPAGAVVGAAVLAGIGAHLTR